MPTPRPATVDFETKGIERRPNYPPIPVGVSIQMPGERRPKYYAWGHPTENNCLLGTAKNALRAAWACPDGVLFHNGKFDYDVATTHMGVKELPWHKIHDTLFLIYLDNPHAPDLSLKPTAARLLRMPAEEQDAVADWLMEHQPVPGVKISRSKNSEHYFGRYICEAPGGLVGKYAEGDVIRTLQLFKILYPSIVTDGMLGAYDRERELMPILLENERDGFRTDVQRLRADVKLYTAKNEAVEQWLRKRLKAKELNFDSDAEVADALERTGIVTEFPQTPTGKRSMAKGALTPDMFKDKRVASALGWRNRLQTCLSTFMRPWLAMAERNGGHLHTNWNQVRGDKYGTRTGRPSCNMPNVLNIPKVWGDKGDGYVHPSFLHGIPPLPLIRSYVLPDDAKSVFGHRDFNQQEFRLTAHFEDGALMQAYNDNPKLDMHDHVREQIHVITGKAYERRPVKIINFGMLYGQGVGSLAAMIGCTVDEAKILKNAQRKAVPDVQELDKVIKEGARNGEPIRTIGGRVYYCEEPTIINGRTQTWEYKMLNYLMQGSAADVTKQAVINYHKHPKREGRFLVTVYDEINASMPKAVKALKHEMGVLRDCMSNTFPIDVPMISDGKYGPNWGALVKFQE